MLEDVVTTKVGQIETASERILGAGLDSLCEEDKSIHVLDVVTGKHAVLKDLEVDVLAIARDVAMVGQSVKAGAGTTSFTKRLAYVECTYTWDWCPPWELTGSFSWGNPLLRNKLAGGKILGNGEDGRDRTGDGNQGRELHSE
jgi:hypothetical protein